MSSYVQLRRNQKLIQTLRIGRAANIAVRQQVKPDDHSEVVPLLPIPNRTVKRLCADDSADSRVKVGHRQANIKSPIASQRSGFFTFWSRFGRIPAIRIAVIFA